MYTITSSLSPLSIEPKLPLIFAEREFGASRKNPENALRIYDIGTELIVRGQAGMQELPPIEEVLWQASKFKTYQRDGEIRSLKNVLLHPHFADRKEAFIRDSIQGSYPRVLEFELTNFCITLQEGVKLRIIEESQVKNLIFKFLVSESKSNLKLTTLADTFPKIFGEEKAVILDKYFQNNLKTDSQLDSELIVTTELLRREQLGTSKDFLHVWLKLLSGRKCARGPNPVFGKEDKVVFERLSDQEKGLFYNLAYYLDNPYITEPSEVPLQEDDYSLSFVWLNHTPVNDEAPNLLDKPDEEYEKNFASPIKEWAVRNPGTTISIWYDSKHVTHKVIEKSKQVFDDLGLIDFKDIREIPVLMQSSFLDYSQTDFWCSVDLVKAIAADHTLTTRPHKYHIHIDLDVAPLTKEELFDKRTLGTLERDGIALAKISYSYENSFIILNGQCSEAMAAHRNTIINPNLTKHQYEPNAIYTLYSKMFGNKNNVPKKPVGVPPSIQAAKEPGQFVVIE